MSYTDKKNEWWRIHNADDSIDIKAKEIFRLLSSKYPTIKINGRSASITSKEVDIYLIVRPCVGINGRALLRYSTNGDDIRAKSSKSCRGLYGEVREGHKYSDGSSRINLDYAFNQINSFIELRAKVLDDAKKSKFLKQLDQMKIVGRIKLCINDDIFSVEPCHIDTSRAIIFNKEKNKKQIVALTKHDHEYFWIKIENLGHLRIESDRLENFLKDSEGFLKYV